MLFITGLGGRADYWVSQIDALSSRFTCITYDHPGIGKSESNEPPYSIEAWAKDAIGLLDALGVDRFAVVGHSTGGAIGQFLAATWPDRVSALCLSGTWAAADARFRAIFELRRRLLAEFNTSAYAALGSILTKPLVWPGAILPSNAVDADPSVVLARIDALLAHDSRAYLKRIVAPTLVCGASDDLLVPANHARQLVGEIAGAQLKLFPEGGHHFPQTRFDEFNELVLEFLVTHSIVSPEP